MTERTTPLLEWHRDRGARLIDFGGWEMPLSYEGIVAEHLAVRQAAGLFDVSHLGKLIVAGRGAGDALRTAVTRDVTALAPGRATYCLVLQDDGGCVDDVFVYRLDEDSWMVVPNASNVAAVSEAIREAGAEAVDAWDRWAILALQGPRSFDVFSKVFPDSEATALKLHAWEPLGAAGKDAIVARTGYTGERGFELYVPSNAAVGVVQALVDAGATPAGLGARDTLRLEMGYALYGHEIDRSTNPLEAGLGWAVDFASPFRGRAALEKVRTDGPRRRLVGLRCTSRGVPRSGYGVVHEGDEVGRVASGNFSPTLGTGIATAFVPASHELPEGERVAIAGRGRALDAVIVTPPFITKE